MTSATTQKVRRRPKDLWIRIHLYLGLWLGLLFAVLGLTGSYNVYKDELDRFFNPGLYAVEAGSPSLPFSKLIDAAARKVPASSEFNGAQVRLAAPSTAIIGFSRTGSEVVDQVHVERSTGRYLGTRVQGASASDFILHLHAYFLLDDFTTRTTGVLGILLLISICSGLYIWWPKSSLLQNLRVHWSGSPRRLHYELHRSAGAIGALILLMSCITGLYLIFPEPFAAAAGSPDVEVKPQSRSSGPVTLDTAVEIAQERFPGMDVRWVDVVGETPEFRVIVRQHGNWLLNVPDRRIWVDQASGQVVRMRDPSVLSAGPASLEWFLPLHSGEALGSLGRALIFVVGLIPPLLLFTGVKLWLLRRRRKAPR
jgi:uncharacterized iron-regulated membrane protein